MFTSLRPWSCHLLAALTCVLAGCSAVEVKINPSVVQTEARRIAVIEFDHPVYKDDVADSVTFGQSTSSNSGDIVADILTTELADAQIPNYSFIPRDRIRETLKRAGRKELGEAERDRVGVAKLLDANTLLVGNVERFQSGFFLMISAATVGYTARCIDAESGAELWSIRGKATRLYDYEEHIAALLAHEAAHKLKDQLHPPPPKPAKSWWPFGQTQKKSQDATATK